MGTSEKFFASSHRGGGAAAWEAPLDLPPSLKTAGSQLKRLISTGHHMEIVKHVAIASLKVFGITDDCM
jgi:hypothetical protein